MAFLYRVRFSWLALTLLVMTATALACGPYYGSRLLEDRVQAVLGLEEGSFSTEAPLLVDPPAGLPRASEVQERSAMEQHFLGLWQFEKLQSMRRARSVEEAFDRGAELPESVRHYMAGAWAWNNEDWSNAEDYFSTAAAFDGGSDDPWPLMGEFMLARAHARRVLEVDDPRADADILVTAEAAMAGFERTRERVIAGEPDPLGLSIASLGEQARILKRLMRIDESVQLYAQQAALGSQVGRQSLFFMTRWARADSVALDAFLDFSLGRELLVLYAYTHFPARMQSSSQEQGQAYRYRDGIPKAQQMTPEHVLDRLLPRLEALPAEELPATDRLAALLYRQGHFERAERTVALADSPLADWVRAKLALRSDRPEQAAEYFHQAMRGFGDLEWDATNYRRDTRKPACLIATEASLLALSRDELTRSLKLMLEAGALYWLDAAYLAEYVLTADELISVVDELATMAPDAVGSRQDVLSGRRWPFYGAPARDVHTALRHLLARRLMREKRYGEAIEYFPWDVLRQRAQRYADLMALDDADSAIQRARQLFEAAQLARDYGLRLLAWEGEPDYAVYGANYYLETGVADVIETANDPAQADLMARRELDGIAEGRIQPSARFSYRFTAAELADRAADYLPSDSEAFAAVLCHASKWLLIRYPEVGREYYNRYRREGRIVDWHADFGQRCPQPDFAALKEPIAFDDGTLHSIP